MVVPIHSFFISHRLTLSFCSQLPSSIFLFKKLALYTIPPAIMTNRNSRVYRKNKIKSVATTVTAAAAERAAGSRAAPKSAPVIAPATALERAEPTSTRSPSHQMSQRQPSKPVAQDCFPSSDDLPPPRLPPSSPIEKEQNPQQEEPRSRKIVLTSLKLSFHRLLSTHPHCLIEDILVNRTDWKIFLDSYL